MIFRISRHGRTLVSLPRWQRRRKGSHVSNAAALVMLLLAGAAFGKAMSTSRTDLLVKWGRDR